MDKKEINPLGNYIDVNVRFYYTNSSMPTTSGFYIIVTNNYVGKRYFDTDTKDFYSSIPGNARLAEKYKVKQVIAWTNVDIEGILNQNSIVISQSLYDQLMAIYKTQSNKKESTQEN